MINDLITELKKLPGIEVLCYADDLTIWSTSSSIPALEHCLNQALHRLHLWCEANDMIVNKNKTTAQLFTLSTKQHAVHLSYDSAPLEMLDTPQYLGITLDSKLSWAHHIKKAAANSNKRLCILRRLTGTKWGATQDVLTTTYKTYIRPVIEYGCEAFATASQTTKKKLNTVQNNAMLIACGAAVSTPITALECQTHTEPLEARRDKAVLKFFERSHRVAGSFWETYCTANARLKTQTTPLAKAMELQQKYQIPPAERLPFTRPELSCEKPVIPVNLRLPGIEDNKADILPQLLKAAALEMLATYYPQSEWTHVYTDGSAMGENCGAGFYASFMEGSIAVGKRRSNFDGEVAAICEAAEHLTRLAQLKKVVFLSDSTAALQAITSPFLQEGDLVPKCQERLQQLQARTEICLQWVPGHCGIDGNERADSLAKVGCSLPQENLPISYACARNIITTSINIEVKTAWEAAAVGKRWEPIVKSNAIPNNLPRDVAVATFRMATGHDYLQSHLHRIGLADSPLCPLCSQGEGTADHLNNCRALVVADDGLLGRSRLYWSARRLMAEQPRTGVG